MEHTQCRHVYTKSICGFRIFRAQKDYRRIIQALQYYEHQSLPMSYSDFLHLNQVKEQGFTEAYSSLVHERGWVRRVEVVAYCIMTTHLHLIIREFQAGTLSLYMADLLNSYTRYFNKRYERKGPLWQGRFGRRSIAGLDDFLQTSSYVFLNPVVEHLVDSPEAWPHSSYRDLLENYSAGRHFEEYSCMDIDSYHRFVSGQIVEKRAKAQIKKRRK